MGVWSASNSIKNVAKTPREKAVAAQGRKTAGKAAGRNTRRI